VVLFLDEIDALHDESLVSVLRQLREGLASRPKAFRQSVALIGLRDVRDYKIRSQVRPEGSTLGTSSPFNVKAESLTLRHFTPAEVSELLGQHTAETGQPFTEEARAEVFGQSRGQPWLVNALASELTTRWNALVPDPRVMVTRAHVLEAREILIQRRDTHLDSLVDKLRESRVQRVIEPILTGRAVFDASFDDDFAYVRDLGLVRSEPGPVTIANPIYQDYPPALTCRSGAGAAVEAGGGAGAAAGAAAGDAAGAAAGAAARIRCMSAGSSSEEITGASAPVLPGTLGHQRTSSGGAAGSMLWPGRGTTTGTPAAAAAASSRSTGSVQACRDRSKVPQCTGR